MRNEFNVFAFIPCEFKNTTSAGSGGCPCLGEPFTHGCTYATVCILWKATPASDVLVSVNTFMSTSMSTSGFEQVFFA